MSEILPPPPAPDLRGSSRLTVASWVVLLGGLLLTFAVYRWAVAHRSGGEWLPGLGQAIIGSLITAAGSFGTGLAALLRRERRAWAALPPFLAGLTVIVYFAGNFFGRR